MIDKHKKQPSNFHPMTTLIISDVCYTSSLLSMQSK